MRVPSRTALVLGLLLAPATCSCSNHETPGTGAAPGGEAGVTGGSGGTTGGSGGDGGGALPDLELTFHVKENQGVAVSGYPVAAVVPLPRGTYATAGVFVVEDAQGTALPTQCEVLNRWVGKDHSIRHALVHFQPDVPAYTGDGTGVAQFTLRASHDNPAPEHPVEVTESADTVRLDNGVISLQLQRAPFQIQTPAGLLRARFLPDGAGTAQEIFGRDDVEITVEESGPLRAVVKAKSPTLYGDGSAPRPGWAIRLYVYANHPFAKLDFQLHNSDRTQVFAGPLYFDGLWLSVDTGASATPQSVQAQLLTEDPHDKSLGMISSPELGVVIRNFWETWPNGLAVAGDGRVDIELWPEWSAQLYHGELSTTGLYWLDDMQQVYKEVLLDFDASSPQHLDDRAKLFQYPPVAVLPASWYAETRATTDLGGHLGNTQFEDVPDERRPSYRPKDYDLQPVDDANGSYQFGWSQFSVDTYRQLHTTIAGGWPYSNHRFLVTGNPADFFGAQNFAMGELNARPQWLDGYDYERDQAQLGLTSNPYGGLSWRRHDGHGAAWTVVDYRAGTGPLAAPRDDQHAWFYHVEEAYYHSGNPWIRDWYEFIAEFRKIRLHEADPYPARNSRGTGHALGHALQAMRVTGKSEILDQFGDYLADHLEPRLDLVHGINDSTGGGEHTEAAFQMGFLARSIIGYLEELDGEPAQADPLAFEIIEGFVDWNLGICNFCYYHDVTDETPDVSNGSGLTMVDPQLWLFMQTDHAPYREHAVAFVVNGIPSSVGNPAFGNFEIPWQGQYEGRLYALFE